MNLDVIVIGGGAAGLSAALTLGRSRRRVIVIDDGRPRNAPAESVHNYLGLEGVPPHELLARGRDEVAVYGVKVIDGRVSRVERAGDGFVAILRDGRWASGRRLLIATGISDQLPDVDGLAARWGRDVLHCPYCHGWEVQDQRIGVLATGPLAVQQAQLFRQLSDRVTLFCHTGPTISDDQRAGLSARGIDLVEGDVGAVEISDDRVSGLRLRDGRVVPLDAVVVAPRLAAHDGMLAELGLAATEHRVQDQVLWMSVPAEPNGSTAVPGVWVAGNVTDAHATVGVAAAAGVTTAGAINADLVAEDVRHAVVAARASVSRPARASAPSE